MNDFFNTEILQWDLTARSAFRLGIVMLTVVAYYKTRALIPTALAAFGGIAGYWIATNQGWFQERLNQDVNSAPAQAAATVLRWRYGLG